MGCASSKRVDAAVDVYRPAPASFAVFDITAIDEPWLKLVDEPPPEKPSLIPSTVLEKLSAFDSDAPHSWDEVSKALENLKPALHAAAVPEKPDPVPVQPPENPTVAGKPPPGKSSSFHTVAELDSKLSSNPTDTGSIKPDPKIPGLKKSESLGSVKPDPRPAVGFKSLKENIFLVRDREEREKEGKPAKYDPLSEFPEKVPPGGAAAVVVYTTSLRGVRRTFEDCSRVRAVMEGLGVAVDERDVALHGEYLSELKGLVGEDGGSVPRVFVKGRYIGGAEETVALNEVGKLRRLLRRAGVEMGVERGECEGCGGARFVPCFDCGGSCKVVKDEVKERCGVCNENGLVYCPACH